MAQAADARLVVDTITHTHSRKLGEAAASNDALKAVAARAKEALDAGGSGGPGQHLRGHFIEAIDRQSYNAKNVLNRKSLNAMAKPNQAAYDAQRIIDNRFAGAVQQKASGSRAAVGKAVSQMEKTKPGSAARGTLRVPKDEVARAAKRRRPHPGSRNGLHVDGGRQEAGSRLD